jgi:hypothetical protein
MGGDRPLEGSHAFQEVRSPLSYRPRSSLPIEVLRWLAERLADLCPARRGGQGGTPPLPLEVSGVGAALDATGVTALFDRGSRGMAKARARWHAPIGDQRTKDQRTPAERDHNRLQAGLRALVEQAIGHLANAWTLRRWRGLLYRARDVYQAAAALICLGRWIHRLPT